MNFLTESKFLARLVLVMNVLNTLGMVLGQINPEYGAVVLGIGAAIQAFLTRIQTTK